MGKYYLTAKQEAAYYRRIKCNPPIPYVHKPPTPERQAFLATLSISKSRHHLRDDAPLADLLPLLSEREQAALREIADGNTYWPW